MAGKYRYPIVGTNAKEVSRFRRINLRNSTQYGQNTNAETILLDFFFPTAGAITNVTGTASVTQPAQTVAATGTVVANVTGTAAVSQRYQAVASTGAEAFTGTTAVTQAAQTVSATGAEAFSGTASVTATAQTVAATGAEAFTGTVAVSQTFQTLSSDAVEEFIGTAIAAQSAESVSADGLVVTSGNYGDIVIMQEAQYASILATVVNPAVVTVREWSDIREFRMRRRPTLSAGPRRR
jgi:hypothetical protein